MLAQSLPARAYLGAALVLGLLAAAVFFIIYANAVVLRTWFASRWGPTKRAEARVVRKSAREYDRDATPILAWFSPVLAIIGAALHYGVGLDLYSDWNFWVTFEVDDRETDFRVPEKLFQELEEGMEGVLTYRGERLLRFALGRLRPRPADPSRPSPAMRDEATPWVPGRRIERKR